MVRVFLIVTSVIAALIGALITYAVVTAWFGYAGGKSGVIYMGGAFFGYWLTTPLWDRFGSSRDKD